MKLRQWNVWYQEDIDNILRTITAVDPDILCLQELTTNFVPQRRRDTPRFLSQKLGMHCFYKAARETTDSNGTHTFGNAIISRYPLIETAFHFVRQPSRTDALDDAVAEPRVYLEAGLRIGSARLDVATVHMSYTPEFRETAAKRAEADALVEIVKTKKRRFVIGGDFNSLPDSYAVQAIQQHLRDAGPAKDQNTWTTKPFSYGGFTANARDWRIDYCFATPDIRVRAAEIIETPYSDHLPILVDFEF